MKPTHGVELPDVSNFYRGCFESAISPGSQTIFVSPREIFFPEFYTQ